MRGKHVNVIILSLSLLASLPISVYGDVFNMHVSQASPILAETAKVILQNGTAGTSIIYTNNTSAKASVKAPLIDYVDYDTSDVDTSPDEGAHSDFQNQKAADLSYDTLTEANAYSLDAIGGYMVVGDGTPDWGSVTGTISFWVKMDGSVQGRFWGQNGNMETRWSGTNLVLDWGGTTSMASAYSFSADTWYFVAIVWDENSDDLYLYIGDENNSPTLDANSLNGTWTSTTPATTENRFLNGLGGNQPVDGHGDDLRYWNTTRNLTELQSDYNQTLSGTEANLRSYFKLDNNFFDTGPNNNDGSASGSSSFSTDTPVNGSNDYKLNLEAQWTTVDSTRLNEELCIKTGSFTGLESIQVKVWNTTGNSWHWIMNLTANQWNNASITSYVTSTTLTIQYSGGTETSDTSQDSWNIDAAILHLWNIESMLDYVDSSSSNVGSPTDRGTHSNFSAQQYGPDSIYDTLTEANTGSITYKNSAESYSATGQSAHNFNYSLQTGLGNERLVVVTVSWEDAEASASISSLTFDGTAMTHIVNVTVSTGYSEFISLWYLLDSNLPSSSGSYNINLTVSESITREIYVAVAEYSGVKQSAPDDYDTDANTSAGDTAITLTAASDFSVVIAGVGEGGTNALTNTNNINNLQEQVLTSSGSAIGHHTNVDSGNITVGWNNLATREGMAGAVWQPSSNYELDLEVQWLNVDYMQRTEEVCIKIGSADTEDVKVDVWNGSGWVNILSNLISDAWNNVSVTAFLNSPTFTIRFKGTNETGDVTQDSWNVDTALLSIIAEEGTFDYALRVNNIATDSWWIRLKQYSDSNINRLDNCTIYFHNSTDGTSGQIYIENGVYTQSTGSWYDIEASQTIYIAMTAEANSSGTSYIYTHLEIRIPNTTTYFQCIITFEIT